MKKEDRIRLVELLKISAHELYRSTLVGSPAPRVEELGRELSEPKPGDLVMEITTHRMKERDPLEGIGRLVARGLAPYYATREDARAAGWEDDEPIPDREVWDITLEFDDGRAFRWENASFIKVLEARHERP